jgi:hypothetical protein
MTLFDWAFHAYIRHLANRSVSAKRSKLNILLCWLCFHTINISFLLFCTKDVRLVILFRTWSLEWKQAIVLILRLVVFFFWSLDGQVIPSKVVQRQSDDNEMKSLDQFVIILSFVENVIFSFEHDAVREIVL